MFTRKPQTILTARMENKRAAAKHTRRAFADVREIEMTSPATEFNHAMYVNIGGVVSPISK